MFTDQEIFVSDTNIFNIFSGNEIHIGHPWYPSENKLRFFLSAALLVDEQMAPIQICDTKDTGVVLSDVVLPPFSSGVIHSVR